MNTRLNVLTILGQAFAMAVVLICNRPDTPMTTFTTLLVAAGTWLAIGAVLRNWNLEKRNKFKVSLATRSAMEIQWLAFFILIFAFGMFNVNVASARGGAVMIGLAWLVSSVDIWHSSKKAQLTATAH